MKRIYLTFILFLLFLFIYPATKVFADCKVSSVSPTTATNIDRISVTVTNLTPNLFYSFKVENALSPALDILPDINHLVGSADSSLILYGGPFVPGDYALVVIGRKTSDLSTRYTDDCFYRSIFHILTPTPAPGQTIVPIQPWKFDLNLNQCVQSADGSFNTQKDCEVNFAMASKANQYCIEIDASSLDHCDKNAKTTDKYPCRTWDKKLGFICSDPAGQTFCIKNGLEKTEANTVCEASVASPPRCSLWEYKYDSKITKTAGEYENLSEDPKNMETQKANYKCSSFQTAIGDISTDPFGFVKSIMSILLGLSGGIAVLLIIISGYKFMTSRANPEALQGAREQLISAIVGLLFIIFSVAILQIIGVDILHIPGFGK